VTVGVAATVATPILIANATDGDAAVVVAMYRRILEEGEWFITYPDEFKGTPEWQAKIIREWNQESNSRFMVARMSDRIVGAISITGGNKERTHHVGMIEVFVDRNARGRGVGRALVEAAILWAEQNPILRKLALHVFEDNARAVALYADLGFKVEGRLEGEFQEMDGRLRDDLVMARQV
jgi:RimJ/RimL family protein N-acetyltransferase